MAKSNVSYNDLVALVEEMETGANDKNRTIEDISNDNVKRIVSSESEAAISPNEVPGKLAAGGAAVAGGIIGSIGAGAGVVAPGIGVSGLTAAGAAATGGAIGSAVPVIGTILGAGVGIGLAVLAGTTLAEKKKAEKAALIEKIASKQNTIIRELKEELEELKKEHGKAVEQVARYKYVIGILTANDELLELT